MTVDPGVAVPVFDEDLIAAAIASCPDVAALHGGRFGEIATYLPGRRVRGIRISVTAIEVHVVGRFPATMLDIAAQVRAAVAPWTAGRPVDVTIEDLVVGNEPFEEPLVPSVDLLPPVPPPLPDAVSEPVRFAPEQAEPPVAVASVGVDEPVPAVEVHVAVGDAAPPTVTVAVPTDPGIAAVITVDAPSASEPKESSS